MYLIYHWSSVNKKILLFYFFLDPKHFYNR
nr:MAG TPA: hypothetical protein [Caudoviricetes sp.]